MRVNVFANNDLSIYRNNAAVFTHIKAGDKLRWESDGKGSFVPKIDKAGISQGLKRTWAYYIKRDDESQGIKASEKAIEFAYFCADNIGSADDHAFAYFCADNIGSANDQKRYQTLNAVDVFSFEAIARAFATLSKTYSTATSGWRKDSDAVVSANYVQAAALLDCVVEEAKKYNKKILEAISTCKPNEVVLPKPCLMHFKMDGIN